MARKSEQTMARRRRQRLEQRRKSAPVGNQANRQPPDPLNAQRSQTPDQMSAYERRGDPSASTEPADRNLTGVPSTSSQTTAKQRAALNPFQIGSILLINLVRLMIFSVGMGAIAGIWLTVRGLTSEKKPATDSRTGTTNPTQSTPKPPVNPFDATLQRNLQMTLLQQQIQALTAAQPGLTPGMFLLNLDTGAYLDLAGTSTFAAASMIKVPVLVAFFQDVDAGKLRLDEQLVMRPELLAEGSGDMQYQPPGSKFSALETATQMIVISDNTATNLLIERLGGAAALNQRFQSWGLTTTVIRNLLADLEGTNTTSPKDLTKLLTLVSQGNLLSPRSRDRLLDIMRQTVTNTLLPQGLGAGATIAHKTGDIGSMVGDTGLIDLPNGQRYVATVMVKRSHNDPQAQELIRQTSRLAYHHLNQPLNPTASPSPRQPEGTTAPPPLE